MPRQATTHGDILLTSPSPAATRAVLGLGDAALRGIGSDSTQVPAGNDPRLSDARTPTPHTHPLGQLEQGGANIGDVVTWNGSTYVPSPAASGGAAALPQMFFVASNGSDTTGVGSMGAPFATAQLAFNAALSGSVPAAVVLGVGDFGSIYCADWPSRIILLGVDETLSRVSIYSSSDVAIRGRGVTIVEYVGTGAAGEQGSQGSAGYDTGVEGSQGGPGQDGGQGANGYAGPTVVISGLGVCIVRSQGGAPGPGGLGGPGGYGPAGNGPAGLDGAAGSQGGMGGNISLHDCTFRAVDSFTVLLSSDPPSGGSSTDRGIVRLTKCDLRDLSAAYGNETFIGGSLLSTAIVETSYTDNGGNYQ